MTESISVVIPTLNAEEHLESLLEGLKNQSRAPDEVVIVDSTSDDRTVELARAAGAKVRTIRRDEFGHGRARNIGAEESEGQLLVFLSQDVVPVDAGFLGSLVEPIVEGRAVAAYARQIAGPSATPLETFARSFNYPAESHVRIHRDFFNLGVLAFFFSNAASACRRDALAETGGFPEDVPIGEDMAWCKKLLLAGQAVAYQADAMVYHSHNFKISDLYRRYFEMGASFDWFNQSRTTFGLRRAGMRFALTQLRFLVKERHWRWLPRSVFESSVKLVAFKLGQFETVLPGWSKPTPSAGSQSWRLE